MIFFLLKTWGIYSRRTLCDKFGCWSKLVVITFETLLFLKVPSILFTVIIWHFGIIGFMLRPYIRPFFLFYLNHNTFFTILRRMLWKTRRIIQQFWILIILSCWKLKLLIIWFLKDKILLCILLLFCFYSVYTPWKFKSIPWEWISRFW